MLKLRFRGGWILTHFGTPFSDFFQGIFFKGMTNNARFTNHWVFSLQFFFNGVCLLQKHQNTKNHVIWCSG